MNKVYTILAISFILLSSCDVPIDIDLNQAQTKIVIDGLITDQPKKQYIKVSRTGDFFSNGQTPRVTDAVVTVSDDANNVYAFTHNPNNHVDSVGYYFPVSDFVGVVGRTYTLSVLTGGITYKGSDKMFSVIPIDKLESRINEDEMEEPDVKFRYYEVLIFAKEPQQTKDFYLFKFYRNDSLKYDNETDIYFSDDEFLSENLDGVSGALFYAPGDKAKVEVYSISRSNYVFYSDLQRLLNNDGGLFGSPPANCRNNLDNGALGYFQVSSLKSNEIIVQE